MRKYFTFEIIIGCLIGGAIGTAVDLATDQFPLWVFIGVALGGSPGLYRSSRPSGRRPD